MIGVILSICLLASLSAEEAPTFNPDADGWFAADAVDPSLLAGGPLDLRALNEPEAGSHGFVTMRDGRFIRGDGEALRFWGSHVGKYNPKRLPSDEQIDAMAALMARTGMNLARYRCRFMYNNPDPAVPDPQLVERMRYTVAAMKRQGVYTSLSVLYPLTDTVQAGHEEPGYKTGAGSFALAFISPRFQEIYRKQLRALLASPDPKTGKTLAEEPALALIELVNEDSLFWWTFVPEKLPQGLREELERRFAAWAIAHHGSLDAFAKACQPQPGDAGDRLALMPPVAMARKYLGAHPEAALHARIGQQMLFYHDLERGFYEDAVRFCRHELGVRCPIEASNWKTVDGTVLDAFERSTYAGLDCVDHHRYFDCERKAAQGRGYSIDRGDTYRDRSSLRDPKAMPFQIVQWQGVASGIGECDYLNPNAYRAEFLPLLAAYGSLQGVDMLMPFTLDDSSAHSPFALCDPLDLALMPVCALMHRAAGVPEAEVVVRQPIDLAERAELERFAGCTDEGHDEVMEHGVAASDSAAADRSLSDLPPLACLAGRVERSLNGGEAFDHHAQYVDGNRIHAANGSLELDARAGVLRLTAPGALGAVGFLGAAGEIEAGGMRITLDNPYGAVLLVPLDGQPVATARRLALATVTIQRPRGWRSSIVDGSGRQRIDAPGDAHAWMMQRIHGSVTLPATLQDARITALGAEGKPDRAMPSDHGRLQLGETTLWYLVERPAAEPRHE